MAAVSTLQQRQQSALEAYLGARQSWRKDNDMEFAKVPVLAILQHSGSWFVCFQMANHSSELSGIASSIVPLVTRWVFMKRCKRRTLCMQSEIPFWGTPEAITI